MIEVIIPTRGNVEPVLAGLLPQSSAFTGLRIVTAAMPESPWARRLIETYQHLGHRVTISMQQRPGAGPARAQGIMESDADHVLLIDDDAVLTTDNAIFRLASAKRALGWSAPIVRFAQGFTDPLPGHTEIWERVQSADPRVMRAMAARGDGWSRVFDLAPIDWSSDQLPGICFYAKRGDLEEWCDGLSKWPPGIPGSDAWLGQRLGRGMIAAGVFCYHFGDYGGEWDQVSLTRNLLEGGAPSWAK